MGGTTRHIERRTARRLSQLLGLFRPPLPARLHGHRRAEASRRPIAGAACRADQHDARDASPHTGARVARAQEGHRVPGKADAERGRGTRGFSRRAQGRRRLRIAVRHQRCGPPRGSGQTTMTDTFALLWPASLAAFCLVGIHAYFGIQVLTRNVIFVDLALAQIAALGATVAFMLGHPASGLATYGYSLAFTLAAAVVLACTRAWSARIPQEALIGVIYVVAAAAAILLIDRAPQGAEHLKQILTGNILTVGTDELALIAPLYAAIGLMHWALRTQLAQASSFAWEFFFYASFGIVVTSSVALAGVLLVFSFLIVPAAIGVLYADTLARRLAIGWIAGLIASAAGLACSFMLDLPTGAT